MGEKMKKVSIFFLTAFLSCSGEMKREFSLHLKEGNFVGFAVEDITPHPYSEDGSCDTEFCFEVPVQIPKSSKCPKNKNYTFQGFMNNPATDPSNCQEGFIDANKNGWFDAIWLGGFDFARPATGYDPDAPITIRSAVITKDKNYVVFLSIDTIGLSPVHLANLRERIEGVSGGTIKKENLLVFTLHDHEAPDLQGLWGPDLIHNIDLIIVQNLYLKDLLRLPALAEEDVQFPLSGFNSEYWAFVERKAVSAVKKALENMKPYKYVRFFKGETPHPSEPERVCKISKGEKFEIDCNNDGYFNEGIDFDLFKEGIYTKMNVDCDMNGRSGRDDIELYNYQYEATTYSTPCTSESINSVWESAEEKAKRYDQCFTPFEYKTDKFLERYLITDGRMPFVIDYNIYSIQFLDENEKPVFTFVVWGNHAEVMEQDNTAISADYPGYLCSFIEKKTGGGCMFQIGPEGGLTTPLGTCIPKMDEDGNFLLRSGERYTGEEIDFTKIENIKPAIWAKERAESLGRFIGRFVLEGLERSSSYLPVELLNERRFVFLPFENPIFYAAAKLDIFKGGLVLVGKDVDAEKIKDIIYKKELSKDNFSCGPFGCFKLPINLVSFKLHRMYEDKKIGFITTPAEFFPEYVIGREKSSIFWKSAPKGLGEIPEDPNYPKFYTNSINPINAREIEGLVPLAERNGYSLFFITAETNSTVGYTPPRSDFLPLYEGIFDQIKQYAGLIDIVLNANGGLWQVFDLPYSYSKLTFQALMDDLWNLYSDYLRDINPPGKKLDVIRHPNQYEESVSLGQRTGDILYNLLRSMIEGKNYYQAIEVPDDPNLNDEVLKRSEEKE
jgi:hypothetical protein